LGGPPIPQDTDLINQTLQQALMNRMTPPAEAPYTQGEEDISLATSPFNQPSQPQNLSLPPSIWRNIWGGLTTTVEPWKW
jgi:hypothetical protein